MPLPLTVLRAARAFEKAAWRLFAAHDLTPVQFNVLNLLAAAPDGLPVSALATHLVVDPSNITGIVRRMKADGLLLSRSNPRDLRQHVVAFSAKGRRRWEKARGPYEQAMRAMDATLTPEVTRLVEHSLTQLITRADDLHR